MKTGIANVYYMDEGEKVTRHSHPFEHMTRVVTGSARVDIFSDPPQKFILFSSDGDLTLPANVDHEITAINDGTLVMNVNMGAGTETQERAPAGGVMFADGSVVI